MSRAVGFLNNDIIIDSVGGFTNIADCLKLCKKHPQCKFWTYATAPIDPYDNSKKNCWLQTEESYLEWSAVMKCRTCVSGPKDCQGRNHKQVSFSATQF